jgi:hypothetical protein
MDERRLLEAVLRDDLAAFIQKSFSSVAPTMSFSDNWHIHAIAHELQRVLCGETKRLLVTMPPRSLKSIFASVATRPTSSAKTRRSESFASPMQRIWQASTRETAEP